MVMLADAKTLAGIVSDLDREALGRTGWTGAGRS